MFGVGQERVPIEECRSKQFLKRRVFTHPPDEAAVRLELLNNFSQVPDDGLDGSMLRY